MSTHVPYTAGQLDLMRRIEKTTQSSELRDEIRAMRNEREKTSRGQEEVVRGENRVIGFTRNEENV